MSSMSYIQSHKDNLFESDINNCDFSSDHTVNVPYEHIMKSPECMHTRARVHAH